jgi:hypothetical protein
MRKLPCGFQRLYPRFTGHSCLYAILGISPIRYHLLEKHMAFKIKDLMIQLPAKPGAPHPANTCSGCLKSNFIPPLSEFCVNPLIQGTIWQIFTPFTLAFLPTSQEDSLASLSALKEQLTQQLAVVEREQAALEKGLAPQTVEEVDMLTGKLNEALKELKSRRAELVKKPKPARSK